LRTLKVMKTLRPAFTPRFDPVDALRGFAIVWMTVFHFCFDLNHFGYIHQGFLTDPFWTWQRTCILSLFLLTAGLGQAIAVEQGQSWPRFWRRWVLVFGAALLVSAGSYWMYPQTFIYFGVLHGIAAMLILVRLTAGWGRWLWWLGGLVIAIGFIADYAISTRANTGFELLLNSKTLNWLGLITRKPVTEDYVPLIPWLGVMWWGMAGGQWLVRNHKGWLALPLAQTSSALKALVWLGRWSLSYYLLHQPVMIGALMALAWLRQ
jgi:uncharacterized membrane protein